MFLDDLKRENNLTSTENGAGALKSTLNACLDAFGEFGGMMHNAIPCDIISLFEKAYAEDRETALRMAFYMRDIRGGQGLRDVFRIIIRWLAEKHPNDIISNMDNILFYGRGDDYLCLLDTPLEKEVCEFIKEKIIEDWNAMLNNKECSLLAKWLPSENASSKLTHDYAIKIINNIDTTARAYRKTLSRLREYIDVTERKMSANNWNKIKYENIPAKAAMIYSDAFEKHDHDRYINYVKDLAENGKINAKSLFPADIIHKIKNPHRVNEKDRLIYNAMWKNLPDYFKNREETGICVVDTSGSMSGKLLEVAISLGIYCADKCRGPFKDHFIQFSKHPTLVRVAEDNICDKLKNVDMVNCLNTDLEAVFDLILNTAAKNNTLKKDMPNKLYIISDMQFDEARGEDRWRKHEHVAPFMEQMKQKYNSFGYDIPSIVYWNVSSFKTGIFQDTFEGENCCMVSGYSPSLFKAVIDGATYEIQEDNTLKHTLDPMTIMRTALYNERYDRINII